MSSGLSILVDLTIVTLLIVTIAFAAVLNRRLSAWRQHRGEFERLIAEFNKSAARAEAGVERLKAASEQTGKTLQQLVTKGQSLRDDLTYLIERAEPLADRMTEGVRAARTRRDEAPAASAASMLAQKVEAVEREMEATDERARAKRELLRALAALR
jgi:chromosome segregation ATPase